jgi:hypothetical protein
MCVDKLLFSTTEQAHVTFSYVPCGSFVSTENLIKLKL